MTAKCYIHEGRDAAEKCSKCGGDICRECAVDYHGKTMCTKCLAPLVGFFANVHGDPKTILEKDK